MANIPGLPGQRFLHVRSVGTPHRSKAGGEPEWERFHLRKEVLEEDIPTWEGVAAYWNEVELLLSEQANRDPNTDWGKYVQIKLTPYHEGEELPPSEQVDDLVIQEAGSRPTGDEEQIVKFVRTAGDIVGSLRRAKQEGRTLTDAQRQEIITEGVNSSLGYHPQDPEGGVPPTPEGGHALG